MAETCVWVGVSGTLYTYYYHPLPTGFTPNQDGNYIYAKVVNGRWQPIYIGEGDLSARCGDQHHQARSIASKGATYFHEHLNAYAANRRAEESDLLANYPQAYTPIGCNQKIGG
jgi:hypothetical protein